MTAPTWQPSSGPPPSKAQIRAKPQARPQTTWAAPITPPIDMDDPKHPDFKTDLEPGGLFDRLHQSIKPAYQGTVVTRSEYTCSPREGNDVLTNCGRLLFLDAITVSDNPEEITCVFCRMRLKGTN